MIKNKLKKIRQKKGLTQLQLANASNVTGNAICKIENERAVPNLETADSIAKSLSLSIHDIFDLKSKKEKR